MKWKDILTIELTRLDAISSKCCLRLHLSRRPQFEQCSFEANCSTLALAMAFSHPKGLLPAEVAFLCEMEMVTIVPRQRLERLDLLGVR